MQNELPPFIVGLGQKASEYRSISKYFNIVEPDWNNGSLKKLKLGKQDIVAGFSLGCLIAAMYAEKFHVKHLILCSPAPDETLKNIKADRVTFLAGEKEEWYLKEIERMKNTLKPESKCEVHVIPNTGHKVNGAYKKVLLEVLRG